MNGILTNTSYHNRLADGRAELTPDGSLTIHRYEDGDDGSYWCESEYRTIRSDLATFGE